MAYGLGTILYRWEFPASNNLVLRKFTVTQCRAGWIVRKKSKGGPWINRQLFKNVLRGAPPKLKALPPRYPKNCATPGNFDFKGGASGLTPFLALSTSQA